MENKSATREREMLTHLGIYVDVANSVKYIWFKQNKTETQRKPQPNSAAVGTAQETSS